MAMLCQRDHLPKLLRERERASSGRGGLKLRHSRLERLELFI